MTPALKISAVQVLGLGCLGAALGGWLKRRIPLLDRLNIPAPIAGGLVYALAALALHDRVVNLEADTVLRDLFQVAFMTTIGLSARVDLLRRGGLGMIRFLAIASFGAVLQNLLGMGVARVMGADMRLGILAGSVALAGGPATSLAFGGTFEKMGVAGATTVAFASATFGIATAGLIGGYIGGRIVRRHKLKPAPQAPDRPVDARAQALTGSLVTTIVVLGIAMGLGSVVSAGFERMGLILPVYIGAMIVAAAIRNLNVVEIAQAEVDACGRVALYLFIVTALLTLRLWELAHLALPMLAILAAEVALCWLMCVTLSFRGMGRDYESAVMAAGFCGFMLGITANAVACMEELVEKYGPAPRAFLIVPVVGAFLIDFTNSVIITVFANVLR